MLIQDLPIPIGDFELKQEGPVIEFVFKSEDNVTRFFSYVEETLRGRGQLRRSSRFPWVIETTTGQTIRFFTSETRTGARPRRTRLMARLSPEMFLAKVLPRGPKVPGGTVRHLAGSAAPEAIAEALKDAVLEHVEIEPDRRLVKIFLSVPHVKGAETCEGDHPIEILEEWLR